MCQYIGETMSASAANQREMRRPARWMRPMDDRILEALRESGNLTPFGLSKEGYVPRVDTTPSYTSERCRELLKYGLVMIVDKNLYAITDRGCAYLDENLDASTLDELDEPPVADQ